MTQPPPSWGEPGGPVPSERPSVQDSGLADGRYAPEAGYSPRSGGYPPSEPGQAPMPGTVPPRRVEYHVDPGRPQAYPSTRPAQPSPPRRRTPIVAPVLAFLAMLLVGGGSFLLFDFLSSTVDTAAAEVTPEPAESVMVAATASPRATDEVEATSSPDATETEPPLETPPPEEEGTAEPIVVVPPSDQRQDVRGSILFTRLGGDIWVASGTTMSPLTNSSSTKADANPVWSPDGRFVYFTRSSKTEVQDGKARYNGKYTLYPTDLMRMRADGSDKKTIFNSLIKDARGIWFSHVLQPTVSSAGNNVAVVSDGRDGDGGEVVLHIINSSSGAMRKVGTPAEPHYAVSGLGHNDPAFSPDGTRIAFSYNESDGTEGDPAIGIFTCRTKSNCTSGKTKYLKGGYANPSWSPKGNLLAVETTDGTGRDIAIITAKGGNERVRLTTDGNSFAPEFSPSGDQIAYLKRDDLAIDVRVMTLAIDENGKISLVDDRPVTSDGEVDGESGLSWYLPKSQRSSGGGLEANEEADPDAEPTDDLLEGAPPPPPGS